MIEGLRSRVRQEGYPLHDLIDDILDATGYLRELEADDSEEAKERIANIDELVNKLVTYEENAEDQPTLSGFLEEVALVSDIDNLDESSDNIVLMTLHSAKGLEFPYVYLCGMEDGIFPGYMSINAENPEAEIEEERRLCYVGITRAMKYLSLSAARQRMTRGETQFNKPSRFVNEIPRYLLKVSAPVQKKYSFSETGSRNSSFRDAAFLDAGSRDTSFRDKGCKDSDFRFDLPGPKQFAGSKLGSLDYGVGDTVKHIKFGVGIVTNITMGGKDYEVTVDFPKFGTKKLLSSFANLIRID